MSYRLEILPVALKAIERLPKADRQRVDRAIQSLAKEPRPRGCVKMATFENLWRVRVGNWRVLYIVADDRLLVTVARVAHRRKSYRGL